MITDERLDELEAIDKARTQGEWPIRRIYGEENDAFVATCSTAMPELIAEVRRLREAYNDARSGHQYIRMVYGELDGVGWERMDATHAALVGGAE